MRIIAKNLFLFTAMAAAFAFGGCTSSKSPAPPPSTTEEEEEVIDPDFEEDDGELPSSGASYDFGGADVGDDTTKQEVQDCHAEGNVYDRFGGDAGKCGKLKLAAIDCTLQALRGLLTDKQKSKFNENIDGKYDGYQIDQCGDCEKDSGEDACEPGEGKEGMIVFFVKEVEAEEEIGGLTMFLPHRRAHDSSATDKNAGSIGDSDEDEDDEDDDNDEENGGTDTEATDASGGGDTESTDAT